MRRRMLKSKIHRATVTDADLNYVGSISLDPALMDGADILEHEQVAVLDIDNGARFETYAITGQPGQVCLQRRRRPPGPPRRQGDHPHLRRLRGCRARGAMPPVVVHVDQWNRAVADPGRAASSPVASSRRRAGDRRAGASEPALDLLVVGSGVAGLSAAARGPKRSRDCGSACCRRAPWPTRRPSGPRAGWPRSCTTPKRRPLRRGSAPGRLGRPARRRHPAGRRRPVRPGRGGGARHRGAGPGAGAGRPRGGVRPQRPGRLGARPRRRPLHGARRPRRRGGHRRRGGADPRRRRPGDRRPASGRAGSPWT